MIFDGRLPLCKRRWNKDDGSRSLTYLCMGHKTTEVERGLHCSAKTQESTKVPQESEAPAARVSFSHDSKSGILWPRAEVLCATVSEPERRFIVCGMLSGVCALRL